MISLRMRLHATLVMVFCLASSVLTAQFAGGTGTESEPWLIQTRAQLELLNSYLGPEHTDKHYRQIADINLGDAPWNPIGRAAAFYGEYDGDGFTITNLNISDYLGGPSGLFAYVTNARISNVYLSAYLSCSDVNTAIGSIASLAVICTGSSFDNCHSSGSVDVNASNGYVSLVGGLLGQTDAGCSISNSSNSCNVNMSSMTDQYMSSANCDNAGGLVAINSGSIWRSANYTSIYSWAWNMFPYPMPGGSSSTSNIGGLTGINYGTITECYNYGYASGNYYIGGIAGSNNGIISKCYSTSGGVSGTGFYGGVVGANSGQMSNSWSGSGVSYVYPDPMSMPSVWGSGGGLIGNDYSMVTNSFSIGSIDPYTSSGYVGGFTGESSYGAEFCYWNTVTSGLDYSASGEVRTTADMTYPYSDSTYVNWDFTNIWKADTQSLYNSGYPFFQWQSSAPYAYFNATNPSNYVPLAVQFNDKSLTYTNGTFNYLWDFGDGDTSTLQNPSHTYLNPGTYTVSLTVTNPFDSTATYVRNNYIHATERLPIVQLDTYSQLNFGSINVEEYSDYLPVTISSVCGATLQLSDMHFLAAEAQFQIQQPLPEFTIPHLESRTFMLRFAPLSVGSIVDTLFIVSNAVNEPILKIRLSGTGLYVPPQVPQNLILTMDGVNANLSWDPVTQNTHNQPLIPDYYFVYFNGSEDIDDDYYFLGLSPTTEYTHLYVGLGSQYMFYRVRAIKLYRGEQTPAAVDAYLKQNLKPGMSEAAIDEVLRDIRL